MNDSWWDRWETEMQFRHETVGPSSGSLVTGASVASLVVVSVLAGLVLADYIQAGQLLETHARPIAALILMTLVSIAALVSLDGAPEQSS